MSGIFLHVSEGCEMWRCRPPDKFFREEQNRFRFRLPAGGDRWAEPAFPIIYRIGRLFCPRDLLLRYLWCSLAGFFWCFCSKPAVMTIRIARQKMHYNRVRFAKRYLFLYSRAYRYGRSLWSPSLCIGSDFGRAVPDYILSGCGLEVYRHLVPFVHLSVRGIGNRFVRKVRESLSGRVFCCLLQYMESCSSLCFFDKQK